MRLHSTYHHVPRREALRLLVHTWPLLIAAMVACAAPTESAPTIDPTVTATHQPTITSPPSERDDHPENLSPVVLEPGGFLSLRGSVESLVDDQDWLAVFVSAETDEQVTFDVELQCGGADTARVAIFEEGLLAASIDRDDNGRVSYEEALATGNAVETFSMGCLQEVSATVRGGANYYLLLYAAAGGETGYTLFLSR